MPSHTSTWFRALAVIALCGCQGASPSSENSCAGPLGNQRSADDLAAMPACCEAEQGEAHCLADVPSELQAFLGGCSGGGYCVPDSLLATGGTEPPATCTAFGGPGACISRCIPKVAENAALLKRDTCTGADELCVPCISPLDNQPTGACKLAEITKCVGDEGGGEDMVAACDDPATCNYEAGCPAVVDVSAYASCGSDAHCAPANLITDPAQRAQLAMCTDGTSYCVPDTFLATGGKFTPPTCTSVAGAEGRCLSTVLPAVNAKQASVPQSTCGASERCLPCFDPITGEDTGACKVSCDPGPTQPAVTFAKCCDNRARCVPAASIPDDQEENLKQDTCASTDKCVPEQILLGETIPTCTATSLLGPYTGVCLSDCLDFGIQGAAMSRGSCATGFKCAPCEAAGMPTGAPGC